MRVKFRLVFSPSDEENNASGGGDLDTARDAVYVCGSVDSMGAWQLTGAVEMARVKSLPRSPVPPAEIGATPDSFSAYSSLSSVSSLDFIAAAASAADTCVSMMAMIALLR